MCLEFLKTVNPEKVNSIAPNIHFLITVSSITSDRSVPRYATRRRWLNVFIQYLYRVYNIFTNNTIWLLSLPGHIKQNQYITTDSKRKTLASDQKAIKAQNNGFGLYVRLHKQPGVIDGGDNHNKIIREKKQSKQKF